MHFRILKIIANSGFLRALECTKFDFGRSSAPGQAGELTALPRPPSWFKGLTSKGRGRKETGKEERGERERDREGTGNGGDGREGVGMRGKGEGKRGERRKERREREGEGKSKNTPSVNSCLRPGLCPIIFCIRGSRCRWLRHVLSKVK